MKLIRWLLSNIILIAFVLALTYAYVYWDNLTGEDTPAGKVIAYLSAEYDEVREFVDSYDLGGGDAADVAEPEAAEPEPAPELTQTASVPQVQPPPAPQMRPPLQQPVPPQPALMQPPARQPLRQPVPERELPQQPAATPMVQAPAPVAKDETQQAGQPAKTTRALWISAREEYHRGNIEASINNYKEVIANSSDNYDAYGELGNVYLNTGNTREAANAYFEAAAILVKMGQIRRASSLLPMLGRLDRSKADELNQLINKSNT